MSEETLPPQTLDCVTWVEDLGDRRYRWGASYKGGTSTGGAQSEAEAREMADAALNRLRAGYRPLPAPDVQTVLVDRQDLVEVLQALNEARGAARYLEPEWFDDEEREQNWVESLQRWENVHDQVKEKYGI